MTTRLTLLALGALLSLSACNKDDHTLVQQGPADPLANELANAAPPPALPSIAAEKSYRCNPGNKVVDIDWTELSGVPSGANVQPEGGSLVVLTAGEGGKPPYSAADGTSLTGTKDAASVTLTLAGQKLTCKG